MENKNVIKIKTAYKVVEINEKYEIIEGEGFELLYNNGLFTFNKMFFRKDKSQKVFKTTFLTKTIDIFHDKKDAISYQKTQQLKLDNEIKKLKEEKK